MCIRDRHCRTASEVYCWNNQNQHWTVRFQLGLFWQRQTRLFIDLSSQWTARLWMDRRTIFRSLYCWYRGRGATRKHPANWGGHQYSLPRVLCRIYKRFKNSLFYTQQLQKREKTLWSQKHSAPKIDDSQCRWRWQLEWCGGTAF